MTNYSTDEIINFFTRADEATTTTEKGNALEDLICYVFSKVPGITISKRNEMNAFQTEEIDVAFWNEKHPDGLRFFPNIILVECKNWTDPVGSSEISWFVQKLRSRGRDYGIFVALNGITGNSNQLTASHSQISNALRDGIHMIVMTRDELEELGTTDELVNLIKEKLCELAVSGTIFA